MEYIDWLPENLQLATDPDEIVNFLNLYPPRVLHPMQKKYGLVFWGALRGIEILKEHFEKIGIVRGM